MQAMEEEPEALMPNVVSITSDTTRINVEPRPPGVGGPRVELVLRLAMMECHTWLGIGGRTGRVRRPKRLSRKIPLALDDSLSSSGGGGPDYRRSGDGCRGLIGRAIKNSLSEEVEYRYLTPARWDEAVPVGVERDLAVAVQRGGGGGGPCKAHVDMSVCFEFFYSEPKALLLACDENDGGGLAGRSGNGGDGEAPSCSICFEEMSRDADEVTDLPGCTHGFHFWCIASWFYKASTCPVCRRDQRQFLPPDYRDLHGKMTIDPDSLPDYRSVVVV